MRRLNKNDKYKRLKLIQEFIDEFDRAYENDFFIRSVKKYPNENSFIVRIACNRFPTKLDQENINKVILNMFPIERNEDEALIVTFMIRTGTPRKLNIRKTNKEKKLLRDSKAILSSEISDTIDTIIKKIGDGSITSKLQRMIDNTWECRNLDELEELASRYYKYIKEKDQEINY